MSNSFANKRSTRDTVYRGRLPGKALRYAHLADNRYRYDDRYDGEKPTTTARCFYVKKTSRRRPRNIENTRRRALWRRRRMNQKARMTNGRVAVNGRRARHR